MNIPRDSARRNDGCALPTPTHELPAPDRLDMLPAPDAINRGITPPHLYRHLLRKKLSRLDRIERDAADAISALTRRIAKLEAAARRKGAA